MKTKTVSKTILASRLPSQCTRNDLTNIFGEFGTIKKCFMVKNDDYEFTGVAYITYAEPENATKAVENLNQTEIQGSMIQVKFSKQNNKNEININPDKIKDAKEAQEKHSNRVTKPYYNKEEKKLLNEKIKEKKGRIIIRNLSFKANEESLRKTFSEFGSISEINILKKKDGKMVGCAFIQFDCHTAAREAIRSYNMKKHLDRTITVDFAIPKDKFEEKNPKIKKEEPMEVDEEDTKLNDSSEMMNVKVKEEPESSGDESMEDSDSGVEDSHSESKKIKKEQDEEKRKEKKPNLPKNGVSKDVKEERTVLLTNLSFDSTQEELFELLSTFGPLKYVLLCYDKLTEHPKGTAFAQFLKRESAEACISANQDQNESEKFFLNGRAIKVYKALSREEINKKREENSNRNKDNDARNLYLVAEGNIREGTAAAHGVSKSDMELRNQRRKLKQKMLKNFHIFISKTRLCIHNIPLHITDKQLKEIFANNSPDGAKITEARIMRNLKDLEENGNGRSRGFGFVTFDKHQDALSSLRKINNNPKIFTLHKRPIVEFSLENQMALKIKKNRIRKSKENLNKPLTDNQDKKNNINKNNDQKDLSSYMGQRSNVKNKGKTGLPTHMGPKIRHKKKLKTRR